MNQEKFIETALLHYIAWQNLNKLEWETNKWSDKKYESLYEINQMNI